MSSSTNCSLCDQLSESDNDIALDYFNKRELKKAIEEIPITKIHRRDGIPLEYASQKAIITLPPSTVNFTRLKSRGFIEAKLRSLIDFVCIL